MNPNEITALCMGFGMGIGYIYARMTPEEKYQFRQEFSAQNLDDMFNTIDQQGQQQQQQMPQPY